LDKIKHGQIKLEIEVEDLFETDKKLNMRIDLNNRFVALRNTQVLRVYSLLSGDMVL